MLESLSRIVIQVFRFEPEKEAGGQFQTFAVESVETLSIMALLAKVHELDPTFACRTSTCFKGKCGSCLVRVNGKDVFACTTMARPGETVIVEPHSQFKVIRDVVVDFSQPLALEKE
ncbi:MAG TPA: 2Fe-2S iron-sulfur cluster-binding protein [Negativicutes bacterium]